ncbi:MAG: anti-sigma factor [Sneathiellales bacterium]|nr:anti-sigma factor [Sneathiellales bacterium]
MTDQDQNNFDERDDDTLAAEYVLGVLDLKDRREAERRLQSDQVFASLVRGWENRFADLNDDIDAVEPPEHVKQALGDTLFSSSENNADVSKSFFWQTMGFWRGISVVAVLLAVLFGYLAFDKPDRKEDGVSYVASLSSKDNDHSYVTLFNEQTGEFIVRHISGTPPADKDLELWLIVQGEKPVSIGLVGYEDKNKPAIPREFVQEFDKDILLAITVEPKGGAPEGVATGPIVAAGQLKNI